MSASNDRIDLAVLGERLAWVRRTFGGSIDLSDLTRIEFAPCLEFVPPSMRRTSLERGCLRPTSWLHYAKGQGLV